MVEEVAALSALGTNVMSTKIRGHKRDGCGHDGCSQSKKTSHVHRRYKGSEQDKSAAVLLMANSGTFDCRKIRCFWRN